MMYMMVSCVTSIPESTCLVHSKVTAVGGCSRSGHCGVGFSDGSFGEMYKPVIGMEQCTLKTVEQFKWKWFFIKWG